MDLNELVDKYNDFIDGKNYVSDRNETGSSDVLNDDSLIDTDNTLNGVGHDGSSTDDEDWNNSESEDSDDYITCFDNDSMDEVNEEEVVDLTLDEEQNFTVIITNVNDLEPTIVGRYYVCSNQGEKIPDKRRKVDYQQRVTKKTKCGALMKIKSSNGVWVVDKFEKEHNHILVDRNESFRLRSHQKRHRSTVDSHQIMRVVKEFAGINDEFCSNILRTKRRNCIGLDCEQAINYLESKMALDLGFFYDVRVNAEEQIIGIFWVDSRARELYKTFGDVIVFDTAYKKSKYKFSFAPFTSVNHHMQCTFFGCGLIADETKELFIWLFRTWLRAMQNMQPNAIFTD
ncbi:protein FAR1-RELATED SEQUENCE 5-like [Telopea speciosissima]|uniref:protein FAR1-RELATED SEQUENCE 5-like n=1 Tax=Telopea speciosissima TaxID=54955 RepID=UPI001CC3EFC2|nr:protein FAR1-RELATED SEQUENCE 5-like [Telopea speciosissima]